MWNVINSIQIIDIIDISLMAYLIFKFMKIVRETRAGQLVKGILVFVLAFLVVSQLKMKALSFILEQTFDIGLLAIIIMFQPELRRALEKVGRTNVVNTLGVFTNSDTDNEIVWSNTINEVCASCEILSSTATGALIIFERQTKLGEQIDTGTIINATTSKEILGNIFYPKTPLHDGAVIIRDGVILAAACYLPKPQKEELINKTLGSRHRAAIGMSENSDAIIIVVSEETGTISIADNGELTRGFTKDSLKKYLVTRFMPNTTETRIKPKHKSKRKNSKNKAKNDVKEANKNA